MKNRILLSLIFAIAFALSACNLAHAQSLDKISRRCPSPNNAFYGVILVSGTGDITHSPCPTKSSIFVGGVDFSAATVTGLPAASTSIGSTITGGTQNSVLFIGAASVLAQDNASFNYDSTTKQFKVVTTGATQVPLMVKLFTAHSGNAFEVQPVGSTTPIFKVNSSGFPDMPTNGEYRIGGVAVVQHNNLSGYVGINNNGLQAQTRIGGDVFLGSSLATNFNSTSGKATFNATITAGGTTGAQVINKPLGTVNFAAAASAITVTNSLVTASSFIFAIARTNDATCLVKNVVPGAGSFVINMTAACGAETAVGFFVMN